MCGIKKMNKIKEAPLGGANIKKNLSEQTTKTFSEILSYVRRDKNIFNNFYLKIIFKHEKNLNL